MSCFVVIHRTEPIGWLAQLVSRGVGNARVMFDGILSPIDFQRNASDEMEIELTSP